MSEELKKCQFCGSNMSVGNGYPDGYDVKCDNGKCYLAYGAGYCFNDKEEAINQYNNAPCQPDTELVDALERIIAIRNAPHVNNAAGKCSDMYHEAMSAVYKYKTK